MINLIKIRFKSMIAAMFRTTKNSSKKESTGIKATCKGIFISLILIYLLGCTIMMFALIFNMCAKPFHEFEIDWFYFSIVSIVAFVAMFFCSVFATQSQLYDAKDNELLLSLPIKPSNILMSRIIYLLLLNYIMEMLIYIIADVVYFYNCGFDIRVVAGTLLMTLLMPFLSFTLSGIIGFIMAFITRKMQHKSLMTIIGSIAFIALYFYIVNDFAKYAGDFLALGNKIAADTKESVVIIYWLGASVLECNLMYIIFIGLICLIPFLILLFILSKTFIRIVTTKKGIKVRAYKASEVKKNSIGKALVKKELKHYLASPMYILNSSLGVVFMLFAAGALIYNRNNIAGILRELGLQRVNLNEIGIGIIFALMIATIAATNFISSPSISLEGNKLWIIKSLPVKSRDILMSKVKLHLLISIPPTIVAQIVAIVCFDFSAFEIVAVIIYPLLINAFAALVGVVLNSYFPKLDWVSETVAVKQSISTMASMMLSMVVSIAPAFLYAFVFSKQHVDLRTYSIVIIVIVALADVVLYRMIITKCVKLFDRL